jgi:hypothetical protein
LIPPDRTKEQERALIEAEAPAAPEMDLGDDPAEE